MHACITVIIIFSVRIRSRIKNISGVEVLFGDWIFKNQQHPQRTTNRLNNMLSKEVNRIRINIRNTKTRMISTEGKNDVRITIDGQKLEQVKVSIAWLAD